MTSQADRDKLRSFRLQAELDGEMKFESFAPCVNGHTLRYTSSGECVECVIARVEESRKQGIKYGKPYERLSELESGRIDRQDGEVVKRCPQCMSIKRIELFYKDNRSTCGLTSRCRECIKSYNKTMR